jgi:DNA-binding XRE family transcriptional regulator
MNDATLIKDFLKYGKANNLNQTELAKFLGVTRETLFRWGAGKVKIRASNKRAIIKILKSPVNMGFDEFDHLSSEMLNEWKRLDRMNRLKILQYIEEIKPQKK